MLYRKLKNKLKTSIHGAKLHYLTDLLKKSRSNPHQSRNLWSSVNDIIGKSSYQDGSSTKLPLDAVNEFFVMLLFLLIIKQWINT